MVVGDGGKNRCLQGRLPSWACVKVAWDLGWPRLMGRKVYRDGKEVRWRAKRGMRPGAGSELNSQYDLRFELRFLPQFRSMAAQDTAKQTTWI